MLPSWSSLERMDVEPCGVLLEHSSYCLKMFGLLGSLFPVLLAKRGGFD